SSQAEIGSANDAVTGELIIDSGASIQSFGQNLYRAPTIVNEGIVSGAAFTLEADDTLINDGTISDAALINATSIENSATINGVGTLSLAGSVIGTGQIVVGSNSKLIVNGSVDSGNTIDLVGTGHTLNISSSINAPITGFSSTDVIDYSGVVTSAGYTN